MADGTGTTSYTYDELDRLLSVTSPGPKIVGYRYDLDGNRRKLLYPDNTAVAYSFDKASQLAWLADWAAPANPSCTPTPTARTTCYQYFPDSHLKQVTNLNGTTASYSYDNAQRLKQVLNQTATPTSTISQHTYTLDAVGNRTQLAETLAQVGGGTFSPTNTYGYDRLYRLTSATQTGGPPTTLVGDGNVESVADSNPTGNAQAFQYTATTSGTASQIFVYLDATSSASQVVVGLYTDTPGNDPGTLLAQGTINSPTAGAWNSVTVSGTSITVGTTYWIAVLAPSSSTGTIEFRDVPIGSGSKSETSLDTTLTSLPTTWTPSGGTWLNGPLSAYAVQVGGDPPARYAYLCKCQAGGATKIGSRGSALGMRSTLASGSAACNCACSLLTSRCATCSRSP
jgi:YD repeat-containing protein